MLFGILVGAILFAGSFSDSGTGSAAASEPPGPSRADVRRAIDHLERAANALEATDYGQTRFHLREVERYLARGLK